jgi:hypothetical protein
MLWLSLSVDKNSQALTNRNRDASMPLDSVALYPELDSKWNPAKDVWVQRCCEFELAELSPMGWT